MPYTSARNSSVRTRRRTRARAGKVQRPRGVRGSGGLPGLTAVCIAAAVCVCVWCGCAACARNLRSVRARERVGWKRRSGTLWHHAKSRCAYERTRKDAHKSRSDEQSPQAVPRPRPDADGGTPAPRGRGPCCPRRSEGVTRDQRRGDAARPSREIPSREVASLAAWQRRHGRGGMQEAAWNNRRHGAMSLQHIGDLG